MKIVQVNSVTNGSTGKIMRLLHQTALDQGHDSRCFYGRGTFSGDARIQRMETQPGVYLHGALTRTVDAHARASWGATKRLAARLEEIRPDVLHLHNVHGYYLNLRILTDYLKRERVPSVWTMHDCWLFTGHCAYFDQSGCAQWERECVSCPVKGSYPKAALIRARANFHHKMQCLQGLPNAVFVSPSHWLAGLAQRSFLRGHRIEVIHNGIDLSVFTPSGAAGQRARMGFDDTDFLLLAVAADFRDPRKGFKDLVALAGALPPHMKLVLVGLAESQLAGLPANVRGMTRTEDIHEMVALYSMADVFLNPTYEDNYPTVNLEALACATPCVTYDTGGCAEQVPPGCGYVVPKGDIPAMRARILEIEQMGKQSFSERCLRFSAETADRDKRYSEYIELYRRMTGVTDGG